MRNAAPITSNKYGTARPAQVTRRSAASLVALVELLGLGLRTVEGIAAAGFAFRGGAVLLTDTCLAGSHPVNGISVYQSRPHSRSTFTGTESGSAFSIVSL